MQIVDAVVRFPAGQPRTSSSGRTYVSALFTTPGGEEVRVFASPDSSVTPALQQLQPGQTARLAIDAKGRAHYCVPDNRHAPMGFHPEPVPAHAPAVPAHPFQVAPAPAVGDAVIDMADAWHRAFSRLVSLGVDATLAAPAASTITIQLGRRSGC